MTILLIVAPITFDGFLSAFNAAINGVVINGTLVKSSIISCSWGQPESNYTLSKITTMNNVFKSANTMSIPICAASGDAGASDGLKGLNVDFPGSSPFVISCGGTTLTCPNLMYDASTNETAWPFTSKYGGGGGGYSKVFPMPTYQQALKGPSQPVLVAAQNMRAIPDIAMNANPMTGVIFILNSRQVVYGGTSIVAPAMAAYIGCVGVSMFYNAKNKTFANNVLYSNSGTFHDIKSGNNGTTPATGFSAGVNYDCCTGLGSLNGTALLAKLKQ
jgi:kumamolisin